MSRPLEHLPRTLWSKRVFCLDIKKNTIIREGRQKKKKEKKCLSVVRIKLSVVRIEFYCVRIVSVSGFVFVVRLNIFSFFPFLFYFIVDVIVGNPINLTVGTKF